MERSRQDAGKLNPSLYISEPDYGIYRLQCGMCPQDKSLQHTEIGDSPVVRAIEQQKSTVISGR